MTVHRAESGVPITERSLAAMIEWLTSQINTHLDDKSFIQHGIVVLRKNRQGGMTVWNFDTNRPEDVSANLREIEDFLGDAEYLSVEIDFFGYHTKKDTLRELLAHHENPIHSFRLEVRILDRST